jgi:hypothetical protein
MGVQTSKDTAENEAQGSIPPRANFDHQLNSHSGPTFSPIVSTCTIAFLCDIYMPRLLQALKQIPTNQKLS